MILLDTNALLWMERAHPRSEPLLSYHGRLYVSPASLLEVQFLIEVGRIKLRRGASVDDLARDNRWLVDDPSAAAWFESARDIAWTRDPFDRLIVAHAELRKLRLATGDSQILARLNDRQVLEL